MPTALLICIENTFWKTGGTGSDGNFVKAFKKSFTLYVGGGMKKRAEAEIDILRNEQGGDLMAKDDFNAMLYNFIIEHYLRKIHCFICTLDISNHFLFLITKYSPIRKRVDLVAILWLGERIEGWIV
jgi:hypothetical protein